MGAHQSSAQQDSGGPTKTCYYELLGVERQATDIDIKKAYRRRALELHPDRNFDNVEAATQKFAEVQSAYEILADPQERAWYDSHRDAILTGQDHGDGTEPTSFRNVRLTSTEEILGLMRRFNSSIPFDDEPTGFFGIARETFEHLALEEESAADFEGLDFPEYPTFGSSGDDYESVVKPFYNSWVSFSTKKSFSWKDKYRLSDAPDRRTRRLMEKENKKNRDDAVREFNDAVRFLVTFVRKRDTRYLPNSQTEAERQQSLRLAAAGQAARSRAANQEKLAAYQLPEWSHSEENNTGEDVSSESDTEPDMDVIECVICNKTFKSSNQLEAHERSKKHTKTLQMVRRHMRKEGIDLELDVKRPVRSNERSTTLTPELVNLEEEEIDLPASPVETGPASASATNTEKSQDGDGPVPISVAEDNLVTELDEKNAPGRTTPPTGDLSTATTKTAVNGSGSNGKVGKAKAKKQKKEALKTQAEMEKPHCSVCSEVFTSRTKLFEHIHKYNHAAPMPIRSNVATNKKVRKT